MRELIPIVVEEFEDGTDLVELRASGHRTLVSVGVNEPQILQFREMDVVQRQSQSFVSGGRIEPVERDSWISVRSAIQQREKQPTAFDVSHGIEVRFKRDRRILRAHAYVDDSTTNKLFRLSHDLFFDYSSDVVRPAEDTGRCAVPGFDRQFGITV
ncbi:hypothetical protein ACFQFH_04740 [Halobaculum halobium]|uniref:Uncharacterized protein n=1 Tax=Halobaculum halobium TaxID=3032281 RepID=A0ABD5TCX1_9EURY|nr:hypothetical protein [Halobaculum sp. SYNS20]